MRTLWLLSLLWLLCVPVLAQDRDTDGDGLSDALEKQLGTDPKFAEVLSPVATDKTKAQGDQVGTDNYRLNVDLTAVALGNVAANRYLWRLDFADTPNPAKSGVIIYLFADGDPKTGRSDMGCEYMLVCAEGSAGLRAFTPGGTETPEPMRFAVVGNSLYLCADLTIQQQDGQAVGEFNVLVETRDPYKWVDGVSKLKFAVAGESTRQKILRDADLLQSRNMQVTWLPFQELNALRTKAGNLLVHPWECALAGYELNIFTEYVNRHVKIVGGTPHTITAKAPRAGKYYFGFFTYPQGSRQNFTVRVRGEDYGVVALPEPNRRQCLAFTPQPLDLKAGDELQIELAAGSPGLVEDLIFMPQPPPVRTPVREVKYLDARPVLTTNGQLRGEVTFVSTWPGTFTVNVSGGGKTWNLTDPEPLSNHRFWLDGVQSGATYDVKLTSDTPEGKPVTAAAKLTMKLPVPMVKSTRAQVPLTLTNPGDQALRGWPVSQGVPLSWAMVGSADNVRLLDPAGKEVPLQVTVLAYWPDYCLKWVLLDFQADLAPKQKAQYTLEFGSEVKRSPVPGALQVTDAAAAVTVNTGVLKLELPRERGSFLGRIWLDGNGDGQYSAAELLSGEQAGEAKLGLKSQPGSNAAQPVKVSVVRSGPLHTVVRLDGTEQVGNAAFGDQQELHFFAGKPYFLAYHTFTNTNLTSQFSLLDSLTLSRPLSLGDGVAVDFGGAVKGTPGATGARLWQSFDNQYEVTGLGAAQSGKRAANWADATGTKAGVTVAVRHLWQLYPKALTLGPAGVEVGLMPQFAPGTYKISKEGELEDKLYFYLKDDAYKLKAGVSKRHELLFGFHRPGEAPLAAEATAFEEPPLLTAPPDYVCGTKVFMDILPDRTAWGGLFAAYEKAVAAGGEAFLKAREAGREYGMLNFGDWWGERGRNWGNIEYDTQYACYLQYARSGDPTFYRIGEQAARHNRDVDMIWAGDPHVVGKVYAHCIGHTGNYYDHSTGGLATPAGGFTVSHTWVEGYLADYYFTGDLRALKAATLCANVYDGAYTNYYEYENGRTSGWHLILTMGQYRATNDPYYLNAARIIVDRVQEREDPGGGWNREMTPGHCLCLPRHRGEAGFMVGILCSGLSDYAWSCSTPDVAPTLTGAARWMIHDLWVPERKNMRYTSCPVSSVGGLDTLMDEGLLRAYRMTGDKGIGDIANICTLQGARAMSAMGKSFTMQIRRMPTILQLYSDWLLNEWDFAPGQEVKMLVKQPVTGEFAITVRPRLLAAGTVKATLRKGGEVVAQGELTQAQQPTGPQVLTLAVKPASGPGLYELTLATSGVTTWDVDCDLDQQILDVSRPVKMGRNVPFAGYIVNLPPTGQTTINVGGLDEGKYAVELRAPGGKKLAASWNGGFTKALVADAAQGFTGRCELKITERPKRGSFSLQIKGVAPYVSFWPSQYFTPGDPLPVIETRGNLAPGGSATVTFDAAGTTDADNDITGYLWDFGDGAKGEGKTVQHAYQGEGTMVATLTVTDKLGNRVSTKRNVLIPPAWVMSLKPDSGVVVEAEAFSGQGGGEVGIVTRSGHSGQMITRWEANLGHWLEWKLKVPRDGTYHLVLRYASGSDKALRAPLLDGQPRPELPEAIAFEGTGGFGDPASTWKYLRVPARGSDQPARLTLTAGDHVLRLTNTAGGLALDQVILVAAE